jgi:hypothetical protein
LWKKRNYSNLQARIVEKSFSKNSLKKNLFAVLFLDAQDQEPKPWWSEKAKCMQKNRLRKLLKTMSKAKESQKICCSGWRWTPTNSTRLDEPIWKACSTWSGLRHERTCYKSFYKLGKQWRMEEFKGEYVVNFLLLIMYLFINNLGFPRKEQ